MKDKVIQITGTGEHIIALTQTGRILVAHLGGEWTENNIPDTLLEIVDIPRFWFGKHKGESIADADPTYLDWCREHIDGFRWSIVDGNLIELEDDIPF